MKLLSLSLVLLMAAVAQGQQKKPECKTGALDPFHYPYLYSIGGQSWTINDGKPAKCVQGRWVPDEDAWKKRQQEAAMEEAKAKAVAAHHLNLWNALRTRVVTDSEMKEILELGIEIIPEKDGGSSFSTCSGACGDWEAQQSTSTRNAEIIFNNALLNQFKMRVFHAESAKP